MQPGYSPIPLNKSRGTFSNRNLMGRLQIHLIGNILVFMTFFSLQLKHRLESIYDLMFGQ